MLDSQDRENAGIGSAPVAVWSEDVVAFNTPNFSGFAFEVDLKRPCILGLSQSPNDPVGTHIPRLIHKTYDLHSLLQLSDVTSSPTPSPLKKESANYHSDSSIRLHRELFDRRSSSPEDLTANDRRWLISDSESEFDSASEINVVALDATVSRVGRIPLDASHPPLSQIKFEVVPLPTDLRGRLQKLERRAKVEVLHDIRPKRELTEQEEFVAWMNKDGVRMLLTPASHAALKAWLDAADGSSCPQQASSDAVIDQAAVSSPVEFRVCVEEDSDVEGQGKILTLNTASDRYAPPLTFSALGPSTMDEEDEGNDADVED